MKTATKTKLQLLQETLLEMTQYMLEQHQDELSTSHQGDADLPGQAPECCSYCQIIASATEQLRDLGFDVSELEA